MAARLNDPVLTLTNNGDDTGFTAAISGYTGGTTNTLYTSRDGNAWASQGSTWTADEMEVDASGGRWFAYVHSEDSQQNTDSDVKAVIVTGDTENPTAGELRTGVTRAATGVRR